MTSPRTPPPRRAPGRSRPPAAAWVAVVGWLLVLGAGVAAFAIVDDGPDWATLELGSGRVGLDGNSLTSLDGGYALSIALGIGGLLLAAVVALAALPTSTVARWLVTVVVVVPAVALTGVEMLPGRSSSSPLEVLLLGVLLFGVPGAVVLVLTWRGARRGAALTAVVLAAMAAAAATGTVSQLGAAAAQVGPGAWLGLGAALVGLGAAVLMAWALPRRRPVPQPGSVAPPS